ncbi:hypothetical protein C440_05757 [Haloferax mucosum ATCC BAA-1512]|uniref:Uncharacterized protein n=2 Tax=Haloferax mucosum TaxID=403181 RepID=M0IH49_9EURY|nr:hypothetical protein C440_05757 [Haloferax mucosum ATCC BAA-1512]
MTEREREILSGEADVKDNYRYKVESQVRSRITKRLEADVEVLSEHYPEMFQSLQGLICEDSE